MQDGLRHISADTAGGGDQSFPVFFDQFLIDPRVLAVHAFNKTQGSKLDEVLVPNFIFRQQYLVKTLILQVFGEGFRMPVAHHVEFAAHDRFHHRLQDIFSIRIFAHHFGILPGLAHKIKCPEHIAVIGDGQCRHNQLQLKYAIVFDATVERLTNLAMLRSIDKWWGTRYCLGGNSESCVDCSAFTMAIMKDVYSLSLPRTAQEQYNASTRIETEELKEGDLVFFYTSGRRISHVGIYIMNNKFVHAAASQGVSVSDLNDTYWKARYRGAGRIVSAKNDLGTK
jgi:hypothetical protein